MKRDREPDLEWRVYSGQENEPQVVIHGWFQPTPGVPWRNRAEQLAHATAGVVMSLSMLLLGTAPDMPEIAARIPTDNVDRFLIRLACVGIAVNLVLPFIECIHHLGSLPPNEEV